MQIKWPPLLALLLVSGLLLWTVPALSEDVGKFTRVVNQVDQLKKGKEPAVSAKVPGGVENQDLVRTKERALAVVQFVDDSTMTISPKSKVTIEDYMYDAATARNKGTIKIFEGVVETIIPTTDRLRQKNIQIITTTAIAGIRGTRMVTVVKPDGSIFYVIPDPGRIKPAKGKKVTIRMYDPDIMPEAATMTFVAERLNQKMPIRQIIEEALEADHQPCPLIKAAIVLGVKVENLVGAFQEVCQADPEYEQLCTPCIILKCTLGALRALKVVEISEMQYAVVMENLAPYVGDIKLEDVDIIVELSSIGIEGPIPYYPLSLEQVDQAKLSQEAQQIYTAMVNAGAAEETLQACLNSLGLVYALAPPPPTSTTGGFGGGGIAPVSNSQ